MPNSVTNNYMKKSSSQWGLITALLCLSWPLHASFIESSIGSAVIDDATATYYNPAALTVLKKKQFIGLGSLGNTRTEFSGQATQLSTGYIESGFSTKSFNYLLPSVYAAIPTVKNISVGLAVLANNFNDNIENHSLLRYAQSSNHTQDIDLVPAIGVKLNEYLSIGAGFNRSQAHFLLEPISGSPSIHIPDGRSRNDSRGDAWGGDVGILIKPAKTTIIGANYRSSMTYRMKGTSTYHGFPSNSSSDSYAFHYWTPARTAVSINHAINRKFGLMGTIQFVQWSIFKDVTLHNVATSKGVLPTALSSYHFHDSWIFTVGSNYRMSSKWIIRAAGTYSQAPSRGKLQVDLGDSVTIGVSMGYKIIKNTVLDCSYAHAFITDQTIRINTAQNAINGTNKGLVNAVALKLTVNV